MRRRRVELSLRNINRIEVTEMGIYLERQVSKSLRTLARPQFAQVQDKPFNPIGLVHGATLVRLHSDWLDDAQAFCIRWARLEKVTGVDTAELAKAAEGWCEV